MKRVKGSILRSRNGLARFPGAVLFGLLCVGSIAHAQSSAKAILLDAGPTLNFSAANKVTLTCACFNSSEKCQDGSTPQQLVQKFGFQYVIRVTKEFDRMGKSCRLLIEAEKPSK